MQHYCAPRKADCQGLNIRPWPPAPKLAPSFPYNGGTCVRLETSHITGALQVAAYQRPVGMSGASQSPYAAPKATALPMYSAPGIKQCCCWLWLS